MFVLIPTLLQRQLNVSSPLSSDSAGAGSLPKTNAIICRSHLKKKMKVAWRNLLLDDAFGMSGTSNGTNSGLSSSCDGDVKAEIGYPGYT